jgi:predicted 3-demethylubiquinone-9 3-methyltransferase (glyoxalase superfamily)
MNNSIYPCLWFNGNAKEAATLYCSLFSNSRITVDTPMVVNFELTGKKFMGLNGGPMFTINPSISLFAICPTIDATNELWNTLIDGGSALLSIDKYPWSERYGWLKDRFGVTWQISIAYEENTPQKITPSMLFTNQQFGRAEEAINFYTAAFSNSGTDQLIHYPSGDNNAGKVMFAEFNLNKYNLIAMDGPGTHDYAFNEAVSLVVQCATQEEIDYYWNKLTEGGKESRCGWLTDKFGVSWQIIPTIIGKLMSDPEKGQRVMQAIMQMKKLDIATMMNA